jgi:mycofactocin precursor peptide MftA
LLPQNPAFHFGTRCHILAGITRVCRVPDTKGVVMEPNQHTDSGTELVSETLVEEVSIDGMCGVY